LLDANYPLLRLSEIIKNMDFSGKPRETLEEQVKELLKEIKNNQSK